MVCVFEKNTCIIYEIYKQCSFLFEKFFAEVGFTI